ncbi:hypothetical protein JQ616_09985 [Bradyrhizobium tropiciagri]|uniref:hypothetical protein n=1 Tax=Bradyrhizobium tropiciagri TaxID=312253 RepID=UPI001BA736B0|nr:hypothetical protein [Bradyrhizobium tropiciagri]MBR0895276.1 hypothetical protein [Bradyrhizobium tropiciagri]
MSALQAKLERFEILANECELIASRTLDGNNRELYQRLGGHYRELAIDMKSVIATIDGTAA